MIDIHENEIPPVEDILALYHACGWTAYTQKEASVKKAFEHSDVVMCAREGDELLGWVRCVSDETFVVFIQDLLVTPGRRREGIATRLMHRLRERYPGCRMVLLTDGDNRAARALYTDLGFMDVSRHGMAAYVRMPGRQNRKEGENDG